MKNSRTVQLHITAHDEDVTEQKKKNQLSDYSKRNILLSEGKLIYGALMSRGVFSQFRPKRAPCVV